MSNKNSLTSVIITTKNEEKNIENCLKSVARQSYRNIEIIVVDNDSVDKTRELAIKYTSLIFNQGPERSAQRNLGAKNAKGKYVIFLDADMVLDPDVIKECVKIIQSSEFRVQNLPVGGVIIPEKTVGKGFWGRVKAFERSFYVGDESIEASRFFKKNIFWDFKGYDEGITGPEDWDMSQKVKSKYKIGRIKSFITHNEGEASIIDFIKKKYYYGKGSAKYIRNNSFRSTGTQAIYFLRPALYRNWRKMFKNPSLACGIIMLLALEQLGGFLGFLRGQFGNG